ncbi:MAG: helix-turn-helix transcriptional regulator [Anaerolineae bacterium]|nr:helix-turn-helix transcriptional regulator [Anaerolineae bacterium]
MDRELLLLGLLRRGDMHGYRLNEFIERDMASCVDLKKSTAYFLLDRMLRQGWVAASEEREGGRPPRQVYHITPDGEAEFQRLLRANLATYQPALFPGDIGLGYYDALPPDEARPLLAARRAALTALLDEARAAPPHAGALAWIVQHRVYHLESELGWLNEVIAALDSPTLVNTPPTEN